MTISRSNFITISVTMLVVLFLFQFSNISVLYTSQATINHTAENPIEITASISIRPEHLMNEKRYTAAIIGSENNFEANLAAEWCLYMKKSYARYETLQDFYKNISSICKLLIVNSTIIGTTDDIEVLEHVAFRGIHIICTSVPETNLIKNSKRLQNVLGIRSIKDTAYKTDGITLFSGFLLGGKTYYPKLKKTIPYFQLQPGIKTYIVGNVKHQKKQKIKNEDLPPLLWRYNNGQTNVFVVNADFFSDHTGLGMLTAMYSEIETYLIYPIVNAQCMVCQNFPYLSNENADEISKRYYYKTQPLSQNVFWPDIVSIFSATGEKFTGMIAPKFEYSNMDDKILSEAIGYYYKQTEQISGELGLSGDQVEDSSFYETKINYDTSILQQKVPSYTFTVFAPGKMPESVYSKYLGNEENPTILSHIRTMVLNKENQIKPVLSFYNDNILSFSNTINGFSHKNKEDLYLRSIETALGFCATSLDFSQVYYPDSKKDDWTKLSKDLSRYIESYWKEFRKGFKQLTISQADQNARRFLALSFTVNRQDNTINLSIKNFHTEASFMVKLSNEKITSIKGGTFQKMENNIYVLTASEDSVVLKVADNADTE